MADPSERETNMREMFGLFKWKPLKSPAAIFVCRKQSQLKPSLCCSRLNIFFEASGSGSEVLSEPPRTESTLTIRAASSSTTHAHKLQVVVFLSNLTFDCCEKTKRHSDRLDLQKV